MGLRIAAGFSGVVHVLRELLQADRRGTQCGGAIAPDLRNDLVVDVAHDAFDLVLHLIAQASAGFGYAFFPRTF